MNLNVILELHQAEDVLSRIEKKILENLLRSKKLKTLVVISKNLGDHFLTRYPNEIN